MEKAIDLRSEDLRKLFGENDKYLEKIEDELSVSLINRNGALKILGEDENVKKAASLIKEIITSTEGSKDLEEQKVDYAIELSKENKEESLSILDKDTICHTVNGRPIKPKTLGQKAYVDAMKKDMIDT